MVINATLSGEGIAVYIEDEWFGWYAANDGGIEEFINCMIDLQAREKAVIVFCK